MSYFELFQESPLLFFIILLISLLLTLFVYGAFPVIFAKTRKKPITKKKYRILCYSINFIGVVFFVAINGAASGGPYLLWTWIFSKYGVKTLESKGLLSDSVSTEEISDPSEQASVSPSSNNAPTEINEELQFTDTYTPPFPSNGDERIYSDEVMLNTCDTPSDEVVAQATTSKKPNIFARIKTGFLAWSKLKKIVLILTIVSFVLFIISYICFCEANSEWWDAYRHYEDTYREIGFAKVSVGCGEDWCRFCTGIRKTVAPYVDWQRGMLYENHFEYIHKIGILVDIFSYCSIIFPILSFLGTCLLASLFIIPKIKAAHNKRQENIQTKPLPLGQGKKQFCKYCGVRIDEDSRFCQSCGKKLI